MTKKSDADKGESGGNGANGEQVPATEKSPTKAKRAPRKRSTKAAAKPAKAKKTTKTTRKRATKSSAKTTSESKTPRKTARKKAASTRKKTAKSTHERRKHKRADMNLLVQARFETVEDFVKEIATNISAGGLFLQTEKPRDEGATLYLRFALADGLPLIEGIGKVVRVNSPGDGDRVAGMGIEFVSLDEDSRQLIDSIVSERFANIDEAEPAADGGDGAD